MHSENILLYRDGHLTPICDLYPSVRNSLDRGIFMNEEQIQEDERASCKWIGFGITKGLTDPLRNVSVFADVAQLKRGLHAELISEFPLVDPYPLCYDLARHKYGFGGFIRWIYFSDPFGCDGVLGIDWSLHVRRTAGIATSMIHAYLVIKTLHSHGIPSWVAVALLNWRMCEDKGVRVMREEAGLFTIEDWLVRAPTILQKGSEFCPRCGQKSLLKNAPYCPRCGCKAELLWKEK